MSNDLQAVADILITEGAIAFRNVSKMAMLVNRDYNDESAGHNKEVDVPVYPPMAVQDVTAGSANTPTDIKPDVVKVKMDQWKEVRFKLSDTEMAQVVDRRTVAPSVERGLIAMADVVDLFLIQKLYQACYTFGTNAGPSTEVDIVALRKALNINKVPRPNRRVVASDTIEAEWLIRDIFARVDASGSTAALIEASLGRKYGFDIFSNSQMPTHTKGNASGWAVNGVQAAQKTQSGGTTFLAVTPGTGSFNAGDRLTIAGDSQNYAVVSYTTGVLEIAPRLQVTTGASSAITIVNDASSRPIGALAFISDALIFSTRPLSSQGHPAVVESVATDPVSGLTLRVEVTRSNKENIWSMDILYGAKILFPEGVVLMAD